MSFNSRLKWFGVLAFISGCNFLYSPDKGPSVDVGGGGGTVSDFGTVYSINTGKQICNESVTRDTVRFPACMLWLNFSDELKVNVPTTMETRWGDKLHALQHDRLTITDTSNTVKWFIHKKEIGQYGQLQDPEWSTHPDYIVFLASNYTYTDWSGLVIRPSDNKTLTLIKDSLIEQSSPHLWTVGSNSSGIPDTSTWNSNTGIIDTSSISQYFGTRSVKYIYALRQNGSLALRYIDFNTNTPTSIPLSKPAKRENWNAESPSISPDGKWVLYQMYETVTYYECYLQALKEGSTPILIASGATDPRWWTHPSDSTQNYIIYTRLASDYFVKEDLALPEVANGSAGRTYKQKIKLYSPDLPSHASYSLEGSAIELAPLPFKGGLSPDGKFLATGFAHAFMLMLK